MRKKCSAKHANKLVARGADTQLGSSGVLAPLATNVDVWNLITLQASRTNMTECSRDVIHLDAITRFCYTYIQHLCRIYQQCPTSEKS